MPGLENHGDGRLMKLSRQVVGFGIGGAISMGCNLLVTAGLHELAGLDVDLAYISGLATAMVVNFLVCRYAIFADSTDGPARQFVIHVASTAMFRGFEYAGFFVLHHVIAVHYLAAIVLVQVIFFGVKFAYYRTVVFRTAKDD